MPFPCSALYHRGPPWKWHVLGCFVFWLLSEWEALARDWRPGELGRSGFCSEQHLKESLHLCCDPSRHWQCSLVPAPAGCSCLRDKVTPHPPSFSSPGLVSTSCRLPHSPVWPFSSPTAYGTDSSLQVSSVDLCDMDVFSWLDLLSLTVPWYNR